MTVGSNQSLLMCVVLYLKYYVFILNLKLISNYSCLGGCRKCHNKEIPK